MVHFRRRAIAECSRKKKREMAIAAAAAAILGSDDSDAVEWDTLTILFGGDVRELVTKPEDAVSALKDAVGDMVAQNDVNVGDEVAVIVCQLAVLADFVDHDLCDYVAAAVDSEKDVDKAVSDMIIWLDTALGYEDICDALTEVFRVGDGKQRVGAVFAVLCGRAHDYFNINVPRSTKQRSLPTTLEGFNTLFQVWATLHEDERSSFRFFRTTADDDFRALAQDVAVVSPNRAKRAADDDNDGGVEESTLLAMPTAAAKAKAKATPSPKKPKSAKVVEVDDDADDNFINDDSDVDDGDGSVHSGSSKGNGKLPLGPDGTVTNIHEGVMYATARDGHLLFAGKSFVPSAALEYCLHVVPAAGPVKHSRPITLRPAKVESDDEVFATAEVRSNLVILGSKGTFIGTVQDTEARCLGVMREIVDMLTSCMSALTDATVRVSGRKPLSDAQKRALISSQFTSLHGGLARVVAMMTQVANRVFAAFPEGMFAHGDVERVYGKAINVLHGSDTLPPTSFPDLTIDDNPSIEPRRDTVLKHFLRIRDIVTDVVVMLDPSGEADTVLRVSMLRPFILADLVTLITYARSCLLRFNHARRDGVSRNDDAQKTSAHERLICGDTPCGVNITNQVACVLKTAYGETLCKSITDDVRSSENPKGAMRTIPFPTLAPPEHRAKPLSMR